METVKSVFNPQTVLADFYAKKYIKIKRLLLSVLILFASVTAFAQQKQNTTYEYDKLNRLVKVVSPLGETTYTYDALGNRLSRTFTANKVPIPGDVNGDGQVDSNDIMEIVNYIMGNASESFNFNAADVNEDGKVDVADITKIVKLLE